jgi:ATP-binding cassette subfamily B (MDR/TAP) protein 1
MTIGGFIIGFVTGWEMPLCVHYSFVGHVYWYVYISDCDAEQLQPLIYDKTVGIVEDSLTAMKTVKSLLGEDYELKGYNSGISEAMVLSIRYRLKIGFSIVFVF